MKRRHPSSRVAAAVAALSLLFASCATPPATRSDWDEPIFGSSHPTTYVITSTGEVMHARDLAKVARVLRRYKTLDAAERALVKSSVAKRLHGLIALEVQRVELAHHPERAEIARLPDRAAAAKRSAALDEMVRREATARVLTRLGNLVAVPLKTSDNRSAVAFARVGGTEIEVAADAGEIDRPIASLMEGDGVQAADGKVAAFVKGAQVAVTAEH